MSDELREIEGILAAIAETSSFSAPGQTRNAMLLRRLWRSLAGELHITHEELIAVRALLSELGITRNAEVPSGTELAIIALQWCIDHHICGTESAANARLHRLLGDAYTQQWSLTGSAELASHASQNYGVSITVFSRTGPAAECAWSRYQLGRLYLRSGDRERAIRELREAARSAPPTIAANDRAEMRCDLALALLAGDELNAADNAIDQLRTAFKELGNAASARVRGRLHEALGMSYRYRDVGEEGSNLQNATWSYTQALEIFRRVRDPSGVARIEYELGSVCLRRARSGEAHLAKRAIQLLQAAQQYFTVEKDPAAWAGAERDIGSATIAERAGDDYEGIRLGLFHYRNALRVFSEIGDAQRVRSTAALISVNEQILSALQSQ